MGDLISRSALVKAMEKKYEVAKEKAFYSVGLSEGFIVCEEIIKEQPIAYDVDKVVKELEKRMEKAMCISEKSAELGKAYERHMIYQGGKGNAFDEAIEIVKKVGGMND